MMHLAPERHRPNLHGEMNLHLMPSCWENWADNSLPTSKVLAANAGTQASMRLESGTYRPSAAPTSDDDVVEVRDFGWIFAIPHATAWPGSLGWRFGKLNRRLGLSGD
jgi:hypothetical protein